MPGFNQTGPMGQGPMTGRHMGRCTNFGAKMKNLEKTASENDKEQLAENSENWGFRYGRRFGGGFGRGRRGRGMGRQNRFRGGF